MTKEERIKNNKLIAKFMGRGVHTDGIEWFDEKLKGFTYHKDWNELMRVVERIGDTTKFEMNLQFGTSHFSHLDKVFGGYGDGILAIYKAVVWFIKWHNENNQNG